MRIIYVHLTGVLVGNIKDDRKKTISNGYLLKYRNAQIQSTFSVVSSGCSFNLLIQCQSFIIQMRNLGSPPSQYPIMMSSTKESMVALVSWVISEF